MKINFDEVLAAVEDGDNVGFCLACGAENWGVEPDARKYKCSDCSEWKVYGAEEILIMIA